METERDEERRRSVTREPREKVLHETFGCAFRRTTSWFVVFGKGALLIE